MAAGSPAGPWSRCAPTSPRGTRAALRRWPVSWPTAVAWGDVALGAGVLATAVVGWAAGRGTRKAVDLSARLTELEEARRRDERRPVLSARLAGVPGTGGDGPDKLLLSVWLESPEPLKSLTITWAEARNFGCPAGFPPGQPGVSSEPPNLRPGADLTDGGHREAWAADSLRPFAAGHELTAGAAVSRTVQWRRTADMSDGPDGLRLRAACTAADGSSWELPVPLTLDRSAEAGVWGAVGQPGRASLAWHAPYRDGRA